jgi:hypothetical protein
MGEMSASPRPGFTRLIVQGRYPLVERLSPSPLATALSDPANQSALGYIYIAELGQYLLGRNIDIVASLIRFKYPTYHLIEVQVHNVYGVIGSLYRRFAIQTSPDFIELIEPDFALNILVPSVKIGTGFSLTAGTSSHNNYLTDLNVAVAQQHGVDGSDVRIAILDTGLDPSKTVAGYYDLTQSGGPPQTDNHGHGTAMTEIVADIARKADIHVIRVTDSGQLFVLDLLAGVSFAVHAVDAHIINLSLGCKDLNLACPVCGGQAGNRSTVCEKFFDFLAQNAKSVTNAPDPITLAAVGNDGISTGFEWPARYSTVVAVGSVTHGRDRSLFSNTGTVKSKVLYCMCPGGQTDSAGKVTEHVGEGSDAGKTTYCVGTSPATAYASAVLALLRHYRSKNNLPVTSTAILDAADNSAKADVANYSSTDHGMGRLISDP